MWDLKPQDSFQQGLQQAVAAIRTWEGYMPAFKQDDTLSVDPEKLDATLKIFFERLQDNNPYFHPLFAGQMLKPPHPVAIIGYLAGMLINPNNHSIESSAATTRMEKEVIAEFARQFGFPEFIGHLSSSGTLANLEGLWVARQCHPDKAIAFTNASHYTHNRMCAMLNTPGISIPATPYGTWDLNALEAALKSQEIGTVVVTLGNTGFGAIDPLDEILKLKTQYNFRIHVDMSYGGYYHVLSQSDPDFAILQLIQYTDSVVIDPHKQGLQPYGCGCILFADPKVQSFYRHDSPYTYYTSNDLHLGEISLECSRAGASAAALWLTMQLFPLAAETGMGPILKRNRQAALDFTRLMADNPQYKIHIPPQMDIVTYFPVAETTSEISRRTCAIFRSAMANADFPLYLANIEVDAQDFAALHPKIKVNSEKVIILRSCFLKPEHADWTDQIVQILDFQAHQNSVT